MTTSLEPIHVRNSLVAGVARGRHSLAEDTTSESYYQLRFGHTSLLTRFLAVAIAFGCAPPNVDGSELKDNLVFYASLDRVEADLGQGDLRLQTAKTLERRQLSPGLPPHVKIVDGGRWGRCLRFSDVSPQVVMFSGERNLPYEKSGFAATVSFWLRVDPDKGLKPGYVDPLQITDKKWNDSSWFVDFTKDDSPRHFRLGAFSDLSHWNPHGTKWEEVAAADRPMVVETQTKFGKSRWTHVVFTISGANSGDDAGQACLFLDGARVGCFRGNLKFTWEPKRLAMMLGIQYIGDMDDLAVFDVALTPAQVGLLHQVEGGVSELVDDH